MPDRRNSLIASANFWKQDRQLDENNERQINDTNFKFYQTW
jgi:hypothetical protein